ncbi:MAG: hypothetical protein WBR10_02565 [Candidatus Acidiferrum sp.]
MTKLASKFLAAVVLALGLCFGATVARSQRQPETFFKTKIGLSVRDIQKMEQGRVVTKVLESADKKYGVLVFGGVYINGSIERFVASYRDVRTLLEDKVYRDVQEFNAAGPPTLSDFDRLSFVRQDIDAIQKCKPNHCDLQVFDVSFFQNQIDWNSRGKYDQFNKLARLRICEGLAKYMSGGLKALGSYTDRQKPFNLYENMKSMLDASYYLLPNEPAGIYQHVLDFPEARVPGAIDFFYWEDIDFGEGPTIRVNRVSMFPGGVGDAKYVITNEQLYASRFIRIALQVFYCVPDTQNPGKPGFYLIEMNDSRVPDFGTPKLSIVRKIATGKGVASTRDVLNLYLRRLTVK